MALEKFNSLRKLENASFTLSTIETFCNLRAKKHVEDYKLLEKKNNKSFEGMGSVI
jgi:hypothetical protein